MARDNEMAPELALVKRLIDRSSTMNRSAKAHILPFGIRQQNARARLALAVVFLLAAVIIPSARAQNYTVLHTFEGVPDGALPFAGLIRDPAGNFYGTTTEGGANQMGTVFKLNAAGKFKVLHTFAGADGASPYAGLIRDQTGNLYGTTWAGGAYDLGTVFKLGTAGGYGVLYSFSGADGAHPYGGLIRDKAGDLYGTTYMGGASDYGTVFKIDSAGNHDLLYSFTGDFSGPDGAGPFAGLIRDAAGNLYGTTIFGGAQGWGTVFKLEAAGNYKVLYSFSGSDTGPDGAFPFAGLIRDRAGNLYGTTFTGGAQGWGTVFKLGATGNYKVLYSFTELDGGSSYARLLRDAAGNFYGCNCGGGANSFGTVFKLDAAGNYTVLHTFTERDGICPTGSLTRDAGGNFYGTTNGGGVFFKGTVFKLAP